MNPSVPCTAARFALSRCSDALAILVAWALCWSAPLAGAQGGVAPSAASITEITLERGCFGCATGSVLVLRRDGRASYTVTGNARHATEDKRATGTVRAKDFEELARFIAARGFFDFDDQYGNPGIQDGAWTTTSVTHGGDDKRVFRAEDAGPPPLKAIEKAIDASRGRIEFAPQLR